MAGAKLPLHGRDHCPGGSDPIPCANTVLDYAWATGGGAAVAAGDGLTTGPGIDVGSLIAVTALTRTDFSLATVTVPGTTGTRDLLRVPAGYYLCWAFMAFNSLTIGNPANPTAPALDWYLYLSSWSDFAGIGLPNGADRSGPISQIWYPENAGIVIADVWQGSAPILVLDSGDGYGYIGLNVYNYDTNPHEFTNAQLFAQRQVLGDKTDGFH